MSIDEVFSTPPVGSPGSCADTGNTDPVSVILEADVAPGLFVMAGTADRSAAELANSDDLLLGLLMKQELIAPERVTEDGEYKSGTVVSVKKTGRSHVFVKGAFGPTLPVYVRYDASVDEPAGSLSSSHDAGNNRLVPPAAIQFVTSGSDDIAEIEMHLHDDEIDASET